MLRRTKKQPTKQAKAKRQSDKTKQSKRQAAKKPPAEKTKKVTKKPPKKTVKKDEIERQLVTVPLKKHKDKNGGHYHVIVDDIDDNHISVGLTTKKQKGRSKKAGNNYLLDKSPLDDGETSYMRRQGTVDSKDSYHSPREGTMTPQDYKQAKVYGERAKQKYLNKNQHKKSNDSAKTRKGNKP